MSKFLTTTFQRVRASLLIPLRSLCAGLVALLLMAAAQPAQAQMEDGELPEIDFAVNLAQHAQLVAVDDRAPRGLDPASGFQRVRAGLNSSVQFSENVSGLLMLELEPNDNDLNKVEPTVDFAILDLQVTDQLTVRAGTPVTGLMNFRGYSDGPVVQGNPLVGNSVADMITAGQGVKLIGSYDSFGFDLTAARTFFGTVTPSRSVTPPNTGQPGGEFSETGLELIGKARYTGSEVFKVGGGAAFGTGTTGLNFAAGDGDYIDLGDAPASTTSPVRGGVAPVVPGETIGHIDAKITAAGADVDLWGGFANDSDTDQSALLGGVGLKYGVSDAFHLASRFSFVNDQTDDEDQVLFNGTPLTNLPSGADVDETTYRLQFGFGWTIYDHAMLKVEGFTQVNGDTGVSAPPNAANLEDFTGVLTELSFAF